MQGDKFWEMIRLYKHYFELSLPVDVVVRFTVLATTKKSVPNVLKIETTYCGRPCDVHVPISTMYGDDSIEAMADAEAQKCTAMLMRPGTTS